MDASDRAPRPACDLDKICRVRADNWEHHLLSPRGAMPTLPSSSHEKLFRAGQLGPIFVGQHKSALGVGQVTVPASLWPHYDSDPTMGPPDGSPSVPTPPTRGSKDVHLWRLCADGIARLELDSSSPVSESVNESKRELLRHRKFF